MKFKINILGAIKRTMQNFCAVIIHDGFVTLEKIKLFNGLNILNTHK